MKFSKCQALFLMYMKNFNCIFDSKVKVHFLFSFSLKIPFYSCSILLVFLESFCRNKFLLFQVSSSYVRRVSCIYFQWHISNIFSFFFPPKPCKEPSTRRRSELSTILLHLPWLRARACISANVFLVCSSYGVFWAF